MSSINERIIKNTVELEQLKQQAKDKQARELARQKKLEDRKKFIIGDKILTTFPNILPLTADSINENEILTSRFENFIDAVAADHELLRRLETVLKQVFQDIAG